MEALTTDACMYWSRCLTRHVLYDFREVILEV